MVLVLCSMVIVQCSMVLLQCSMVLVQCSMVLVQYNMELVQCSMVLVQCSMVLVQCCVVCFIINKIQCFHCLSSQPFFSTENTILRELGILYSAPDTPHFLDRHEQQCPCTCILNFAPP